MTVVGIEEEEDGCWSLRADVQESEASSDGRVRLLDVL